jgi:endonuclease VIII
MAHGNEPNENRRYSPPVPEGHTIHRIAQDHEKLLVGRPVQVTSPQGRFSDGAAIVDGQVLTRLEAYGKHLFYWWEEGQLGHVHLGLFGKFRVQLAAVAAEPGGAVRMRMEIPGEVVIDLAGPTACSIGVPEERDAIVGRLGPDPLREDAKADVAIAKLIGSKQAIGTLLLDQSKICGVGNVYRAEALFICGIHPNRPGNECNPAELEELWKVVTQMLRQGVRDNRIVTIDKRDLPAGRLKRGDTTWVYHRDRCLKCDSPVRTSELGGRPCYYCPTCQAR